MSMLLQMINYETIKMGRSYKMLTTFSDMGYLLVIHIVFIHDQSKFNSKSSSPVRSLLVASKFLTASSLP